MASKVHFRVHPDFDGGSNCGANVNNGYGISITNDREKVTCARCQKQMADEKRSAERREFYVNVLKADPARFN